MYKTPVVKILKSLSKMELRDLGKFVQSPYFNSRPEVVQLYEALSKSLDEAPSVYEKEKLYKRLAPISRAYDDAQMRQWIHQLLKVIKAYFIQKEVETHKTDAQLLLAKAFRKRGLDELFEKEIDNVLAENAEQPHRHADFHFKNYQINAEKIEYASLTRRKGDMPFDELMQSLSTFFATEMLRLSSVSLSYQTVSQRLVESPMLNEVLNWLEKSGVIGTKMPPNDDQNAETTQGFIAQHAGTEGGVLKIYYHTFMALKTNNALNFNELKRLLTAHWQELPETECRTIYLLAFNFCTKKINNAEWEYLGHFFDLTEAGLKNRSLFENGIISKFTYKNAVTAALRLEKYDWARQFLEEYKPFLHPKERDAVYAYNLATFYFRKKDYDNAQLLFHQADFGDIPTNFAAKAMLLRIYAETNAEDALESLMDSFQIYIQRQKDIGYLKDNYLNFIRIVRRTRHLSPSDKAQRKALWEEVSAMKNIVEKEWLLEKLA